MLQPFPFSTNYFLLPPMCPLLVLTQFLSVLFFRFCFAFYFLICFVSFLFLPTTLDCVLFCCFFFILLVFLLGTRDMPRLFYFLILSILKNSRYEFQFSLYIIMFSKFMNSVFRFWCCCCFLSFIYRYNNVFSLYAMLLPSAIFQLAAIFCHPPQKTLMGIKTGSLFFQSCTLHCLLRVKSYTSSIN